MKRTLIRETDDLYVYEITDDKGTVTGYDEVTKGLTPQEQTNSDTLTGRAEQALQANRTFIAIASPSNAQVVAQVKTLTRENTALIRLLLGRFEDTE